MQAKTAPSPKDAALESLDDPILKYVPELAAVHNPFGPTSAITLRQILSHTAGFRAGTWPFGGDKPWHPHEPAEWSQLVAMMPYTEVREFFVANVAGVLEAAANAPALPPLARR